MHHNERRKSRFEGNGTGVVCVYQITVPPPSAVKPQATAFPLRIVELVDRGRSRPALRCEDWNREALGGTSTRAGGYRLNQVSG